MTHSTTVEARANSGSYKTIFATLDITSLDNANNEAFDAAAEFNLNEVLGVSVVGVENADSYVVQWDHLETDLYVEGYGGTDPTAGTDVGEVVVRVDGNPSA